MFSQHRWLRSAATNLVVDLLQRARGLSRFSHSSRRRRRPIAPWPAAAARWQPMAEHGGDEDRRERLADHACFLQIGWSDTGREARRPSRGRALRETRRRTRPRRARRARGRSAPGRRARTRRRGERDGPKAELEQAVAAAGLQVVLPLRHGAGDELDLPLIEAEALVGLRACGSIARSFGRKMRCGQLSMMAGAIVLFAMSASDWVAKTTATFFLRSTFSHSRMRAAKSGLSRKTQASSRMRSVGRPSKRASSR